MKKIAHIITDLNIGGAELMLLKTLRNFSNKYEHFVISLLPMGRVGNMIKDRGFRVYTLNLKMLNFPISFMRLLYILKKERPDIVHNYLFHADILGRIAARIMRVPIIISSLRNENIGGRLQERLLGMTDFCIDKVTAVSRNVADVHILKGTTKKDKVQVIYNGFELRDEQPSNVITLRRNMNIEDDAFLLLMVANLKKKKGHTFLFSALQPLKEKGYKFRLLVVGSGKERKNLEKEIVNKRLEKQVILAGERADISGLLSISDIFILPSIWEGLPNALLEAMATGLPVVATRVGGVPEIVIDNETGLLVKAKDSHALRDAIERLIKEPPLRERLARNARIQVRERFDIKQTVTDIEKLYEGLLKDTDYRKIPKYK